MNRWDWIKAIGGFAGSADKGEAANAALVSEVREGFESIANTLRNFEAEVIAKFQEARQELNNFGLAVNAKIRKIEERLAVLEEILFEPDPSIRQEKITAMKPVIRVTPESPTFPLDRSKL